MKMLLVFLTMDIIQTKKDMIHWTYSKVSILHKENFKKYKKREKLEN